MPPFPGEERLLTLFTDCHCYFEQPTARPDLHRFDKASYFYIYYNSTRHTSRIEVANNPGTPTQDAFNGSLDTCRVVNSYKFPTLVTLIVDAVDSAPSPTSSKAGRDPEEWRLSSANPRDSNYTRHRIHTVDFYFWTQEDARLVTGFFKKLLPPTQLDIVESKEDRQQQQQQRQQQHSPPAKAQQPQSQQASDIGVSSVVQNLENVAVSDPAYSNGQTRNSQNQAQSQPIMLPPPPPMPSQSRTESRTTASPSTVSPSAVSYSSRTESRLSAQPESSSVDYTPVAYNPAAPAAPEKIAHREKTPPPEDGVQGTGLSSAAMHDNTSTPGIPPSQQWGGPPTSQVSHSSHWGSPPPPSATSGYGSPPASSVGYASSTPVSQYQHGRSSVASTTPSFAPPPTNPTPTQDPHRHSTAAETYTPSQMMHHQQQPVETPGSQFYSTIQQPTKPLQHVQPQYADYLAAGASRPGQQPPPGGWSNYSYAQSPQSAQHVHQSEYDTHNQVYRPTEEEANGRSRRKASYKDSGKSSEGSSAFSRFVNKASKTASKATDKYL